MKRIDIILELALVFALVLILLMRTTEHVEAPAPTVTLTPTFTQSPEPTPTPIPTFTPTPTSSPTPTPIPSVEKDVEPGHEFKPYTGFWAYNAKGTAQHSLQMVARSDERTGIRIVTDPLGVDRFCVALGAAWAGGHPEHIGRCVDVVMINGAVLPCVLADVKQQVAYLQTFSQLMSRWSVSTILIDERSAYPISFASSPCVIPNCLRLFRILLPIVMVIISLLYLILS